MDPPAGGADPFPDGQILHFGILEPAGRTGLRAREEPADLHETPAPVGELIPEHADELSPSGVVNRLAQTQGAGHSAHIEVLDADDAVRIGETPRFLMQEVLPAVRDLLVSLREPEPLLFQILRTLRLAGETPLLLLKPRLGLPAGSAERSSPAVAVDEEVMGGEVEPDRAGRRVFGFLAFELEDEACVILSAFGHADGDGRKSPTVRNVPMLLHADDAELRKAQAALLDADVPAVVRG